MTSADPIVEGVTKSYIGGLGEGIFWANLEAEKKSAPLYCSPEKLVLRRENFEDIIGRQLKRFGDATHDKTMGLTQAQLDDAQVGMLLLLGLKEAFPCKGK